MHHESGEAPSEPIGLILRQPRRYDARLWLMTRGREARFRRHLLDLGRISRGERVLDVGCGTGTLAIEAARRVGPSGEVHGIDPSPEMIRRARAKARSAGVLVGFQEAPAQHLPYPDGRFDAVLATFVLHQLPASVLPHVLSEMRRVLTPTGRVVLVDIGGPQHGDTVHVRAAERHGVHLFDLTEIGSHLAALGFREIDSGDIGYRLWRFEQVRYLVAARA